MYCVVILLFVFLHRDSKKLTLASNHRQNEIQTLSTSEKQAQEKMSYFKRELENQETNFNRRFAPPSDDAAASNSPLRVNQSDNSVSKPKQTKPRRRVCGKTGAGTRKKKATASTKLPRIAK